MPRLAGTPGGGDPLQSTHQLARGRPRWPWRLRRGVLQLRRRDGLPEPVSQPISASRRERAGIRGHGSQPTASIEACPHLRLAHEPESHASHPHADHRCARDAGPAPAAVHQLVFCLTEQGHVRCPSYAPPEPQPRVVNDAALPYARADAAPSQGRTQRRRLTWAAGGLGALAAVVAGATLGSMAIGFSGEAATQRVAAAVSSAVTPAGATSAPEAPALDEAPSAAPPAQLDREPAQPEPAIEAGGPPADLDASAAPAPRHYVVEPGDSLLAIALAFDVELDALLAANDLRVDDLILVGRDLLVPAAPQPVPGG